MASTPAAITDALPGLYQDLKRLHLVPLWEIAPRLLPHEPQPQAVPYLWRWPEIAPLAHRAAELVPLERGGERRVIAFMNPSFGGKWAATSTLWAGVGPSSPLLNYKWERTEEALPQLATSRASPFDDVALEYIN